MSVEIAYGPQYQAQVADVLGVPLKDCTRVSQNVYLRPYWQAWRLPDGRVAWIINRTFVDAITIYATYADWVQARRAHDAGYPDPETMRR